MSTRGGGTSNSLDGAAPSSWDDLSLDEEYASLFHEGTGASIGNKTVGISASSSQFKNCILRQRRRYTTQQQSPMNESTTWFWLKIAGLMALMVLIRMSSQEFEHEKLVLGTQPSQEEHHSMGIWFEDEEWNAPSVSFNSTEITANTNSTSIRTPYGPEDPDQDEEEIFSDSPGPGSVPEDARPNRPKESEGIWFENEAQEGRKEEADGKDKVESGGSNHSGGKK
jgi:hypothetical protein